jgi:hypothetical protein
MANEFNLLEKYEWLGEFWPKNEAEKFPGILRYSPQEGITVSALVNSGRRHNYCEKTLYGYCQETGYLTLYGCFVKSEGTSNLVTNSPTLYASYAIMGGQFPTTDSFESCQFELAGLDEFCYPQGFKLQNKFTSKSICEAETSDAKIFLAKIAKGRMIGKGELSSLIILDEENDDFEKELNSFTEELMEKHNVSFINSKSDISHVLRIENKGSLSREGILKYMFSLKQLFSLLLLRPTCLKNISLTYRNDEDKIVSCQMLYSLLIPEREIRQLDRDVNYHSMKVNVNNIKDSFQKIFSEWDKLVHDKTDIILNTLSSHIGGDYNTVQHTVTFISCLEQWYHKYEESNESKYDCVVNRYGTNSLKDFIIEKAPLKAKNGDTVGQLLSNIRGIVLHPNGARKYTAKNDEILDHSSFANTSEAIFIILLRAIFTKLGVSKESIDKFGTEAEPVLCTHHNIDV